MHAVGRLAASLALQGSSASLKLACNGRASQLCMFANRTFFLAIAHRSVLDSLLLFLIFFPRATPSKPNSANDPEGPSIHTALAVTAVCLGHGIITLILSLYFILVHPSSLQSWANFLGIFSTVLASIQYFPQIYTTFTLKKVGSLSIPMMCIQTPGSFVWAASLAARLGKEGWSAWGVYLVTGCLQGSLLVMGIYFELRERKRQGADEQDASPPASDAINGTLHDHSRFSEQTPLLQSAE